jgi:hypothetical protein
MSKTIVLAVDAARHELSEHVAAAVEMTRDVARSGLHIASLPVLIVPMHREAITAQAV